MSVAECKIDQSAMSGGAANNKIPGITKYNNFFLTSKSMRVWQAYNVVEGMDIEGSTVREYFSRLASQQKGLLVSEEEGEDEELEKDDYMEQLVGVAEQEIGLRQPLVYDDFNFCDLSAKGGKAKTQSVILRVF